MALTLRLPEELDSSLTSLAKTEQKSKQALIIESIQKMIEEKEHLRQIMEGVDYALDYDAEALELLADA